METNSVLNVAVIGLGGFARDHHRALAQLEEAGICQVIAACDPDPDCRGSGARDFQFEARRIPVFSHYREMLDAFADSLDIVTVPTPIPLHAEMHRACVEAGIACYLEKPPTCYDVELEEMLQVEANAKHKTNVGFNFIIEPQRQALKHRLLAGEFGTLREVRLLGLWPRTDAYFRRSNWAGRLTLNGAPVLDSIFGNAMAHYTHNVLFWAGVNDLFDWSPVTTMTAEMYRAHAIEGTDTLFAIAQTGSGVSLRFAMTHACDGSHRQREEVICDDATIEYTVGKDYKIRWRDGREEVESVGGSDLLRENLAAYIAYCKGELPRPMTTLTDCRPFVRLNTLAYVAAGHIATVTPSQVNVSAASATSDIYRSLKNIETVAERFLSEGQFPTEQDVEWSSPGSSASDTANFLPVLAEMSNSCTYTITGSKR